MSPCEEGCDPARAQKRRRKLACGVPARAMVGLVLGSDVLVPALPDLAVEAAARVFVPAVGARAIDLPEVAY